MQLRCCTHKVTRQKKRHHSATPRQAIINRGLIFSARRMQNEICNLLGQAKGSRVTNTQTQTPKVCTSKHRLDISQPIMTGVTAPLLDFDLTWKEIKLVVQYQYFLCFQFIEPR
jgi:hypothetical protein